MAAKEQKKPENPEEAKAPSPKTKKSSKKTLIMMVLPLATFIIFVFIFSSLFGVDIGVAISPPPAPEVQEADSNSTAEAVDTATVAQPDSTDSSMIQNDSERQELQNLRDEIKGYTMQKEGQRREDIRSLAKLYDGIKEEQLAYIFEHMEDSLIVLVLPEMKSRNASKALELLKPERAAQISKLILERNP